MTLIHKLSLIHLVSACTLLALLITTPNIARGDSGAFVKYGNGWEINIAKEQLQNFQFDSDEAVTKLIQALISGQEDDLLSILIRNNVQRKAFYDYLTLTRHDTPSPPEIYSSQADNEEPIDTDQKTVTFALGSIGSSEDDTLKGNDHNNWLAGGEGSDDYEAGDGNDVLFIDAEDIQIYAGKGTDIAVAVGNKGITLNLAKVEVEMALGGKYGDILIGGGRSTVFMDGGAGDDILIGSAANDVISGGGGSDLVDGGAGNDLIQGGSGKDQLLGGAGDDIALGGAEDDRLVGGASNDVLEGGQGDDVLEGGDGTDLASFSGKLSEYRIFKLNENTWRISDTLNGRDGNDTLTNIEKFYFNDVHWLDMTSHEPIPVNDIIEVAQKDIKTVVYNGTKYENAIIFDASELTKNDINWPNEPAIITTLIGADGKDIPAGEWARVHGAGWITLTPDHKILYQAVTKDSYSYQFWYRLVSDSNNPRVLLNRTTNKNEFMVGHVTVNANPTINADKQ